MACEASERRAGMNQGTRFRISGVPVMGMYVGKERRRLEKIGERRKSQLMNSLGVYNDTPRVGRQ